MSVVVRFAPSPTGFLHIGGARTALFNWLFARHHQLHGDGGIFRLRIEDTDRLRSTQEVVAAIIDGLDWLGLTWDGEIVHQAANAARHAEMARELLAAGRAYHCYCTPAELEAIREQVLGEVSVDNQELDDLIILRSDGSPTYNLSVVVDDHDMGITHVIRGGEHFRNAFRQTQIYRSLDWPVPEFAHIPLIHGADGSKLSKRHGALGIEAYREMGYLPEALRNYLVRLGWGHGDDEIITTDQAIAWFDLADVGRAPAQFDFAKLDSINAHYIRIAEDARLVGLVAGRLEAEFGRPLAAGERERLLKAIPGLKPRAKTIVELAENSRFYVMKRPVTPSGDAAKMLTPEARERLGALAVDLGRLADAEWRGATLDERLREFAGSHAVKLGAVAQPLRAALTGSLASPGIFEVMEVLGREESLARIEDAALHRP